MPAFIILVSKIVQHEVLKAYNSDRVVWLLLLFLLCWWSTVFLHNIPHDMPGYCSCVQTDSDGGYFLENDEWKYPYFVAISFNK